MVFVTILNFMGTMDVDVDVVHAQVQFTCKTICLMNAMKDTMPKKETIGAKTIGPPLRQTKPT